MPPDWRARSITWGGNPCALGISGGEDAGHPFPGLDDLFNFSAQAAWCCQHYWSTFTFPAQRRSVFMNA
jgi:hypothetical protein